MSFVEVRSQDKKPRDKNSAEQSQPVAEKSALWTDAGVDQNFQRDLVGIGPCEFQGKFAMDHSCTRVRGPPVALHVSHYTCRSRFPQNPGVFQV